LAVNLTAVGGPATVTSVGFELLGTAPLSDIGSLTLLDATGTPLGQRTPVGRTVSFSFSSVAMPADSTTSWTLAASISGTDGTTLGARIAGPYDVGVGNAVVTLATSGSGERLGYIGAIPAGHVVDGAFRDWTNDLNDTANEPTTGGNPSVDIGRFAALFGAANVTFHVALHGPAFAGTVLTRRPNAVPSGGPQPLADRDRDTVPDSIDPYPDDFNNDGIPDVSAGGDVDGDGARDYTDGGTDQWLNTSLPMTFPNPYAGRNVSVYIGPQVAPVPPPPMIGTDEMRLFVDADNVSATGYFIAGIGADYLIDVQG